MIQILIEGRELELPSDISFEYTVENRLFSNADGYSFDIEIPLKESAVNSDIFGMVFDPQADIDTLKYQAQLITPQLTLSGIVAIVGVSESLISIQFLEGRSVQNFEKDLDEVYVNELKIESFSVPSASDAPVMHWGSYDAGTEAVAIPWVNDNSGVVQNNVVKSDSSWVWDSENRGLSYMPFLCVLIHRICDSIGYHCDISELENSRFRHLLVCNALPAALGISDYTEALPHWSVSEFFENLEVILRGEFDFDNVSKYISFRFTENILGDIEPVALDQVVDEFSAEIDTMNEDKTDLDLLQNIAFKDNGSRFWKLLSCDWFIELRRKNPDTGYWVIPGTGGYAVDENGHRVPVESEISHKSLVDFNTLDNFLSQFKGYEYFGYHRNDIVQHNVYYCNDCSCYFVYHSTDYLEVPGKGWVHHFEAFPVNEFGAYIIDPEHSDDCIEISTVPVPIDEAEFKCAYLYFSNNADNDVAGDDVFLPSSSDEWDEAVAEITSIQQPRVYQSIMTGESNKPEYFDRINLGFWPGYQPYHDLIGIRPITSNVVIYDYWKAMQFPEFSLRLNHEFSRGVDAYKSIDAKRLYKFSFLADTLPSARATFYIKGKRYVCAKLTASFSADGMSRLVKGEFYRY